MKSRIAIIDLGTNTFNLLIVDKDGDDYSTVYSQKIGVGLGLGGINEGKIGDEAWARGIDALKEYKSLCEDKNAQKIFAFGTSAIRNATNGNEFVIAVKDEVGIDIKVISGMEEAELIYKGVHSGSCFEGISLIMDIGGGSTEFILADHYSVKKSRSFEIGVSRIFQLFNPSDPYSEEDCNRVYKYLEEKTEDFFDDIETEVLFGSSGSFETFYELVTNKPYPEDTYVRLDRDEIMKSLDHVIASTQKERDENKLIIPIRKKMAPIAALKIKWVIEKLNIKEVYISPYSLKEGVLRTIKD